jgi:hypothetical protein
MNSLASKLFKDLTPISGYINVINPKIGLVGKGKFSSQKTPE